MQFGNSDLNKMTHGSQNRLAAQQKSTSNNHFFNHNKLDDKNFLASGDNFAMMSDFDIRSNNLSRQNIPNHVVQKATELTNQEVIKVEKTELKLPPIVTRNVE